MLLSDVEIIQFRKSKIYKKYNHPFKMFKIVCKLRNENFATLSVTVGTNGLSGGISSNIVKAFWFFLKYFVISIEIKNCRNYISEKIINKDYSLCDSSCIVEESINIKCYYWMEYSEEKVKKMEFLCKEIFNDVEVREELKSNASAYNNEDEKILKIQEIINNLDRIFKNALEKIEDQVGYEKYCWLQKKRPEYLIGKFLTNQINGNLTDENKED